MKIRRKPRRGAPAVEALELRQYFALYLNDIDSLNMGKGMWAWDLSDSMANDGFSASNFTGWFNYLQSNYHLDYVITKAANGDDINSQYTPTVVNAAHAAGIKLFPYFYLFGNYNGAKGISSVSGEVTAFNSVMNNVGADGVVFDIENEYGATATKASDLTNYFTSIGRSGADYATGSGTRDKLFMAYSTYDNPAIQLGSPYWVCADFCDAAMPQMYWKAHGYTIASDFNNHVDVDYRNTAANLMGVPPAGHGTSNIKPVIPTGQAYNNGNGLPTAAETASYFSFLKADTNAVGPANMAGFRYKSVNYFDHHTLDAGLKAEIAAEVIGDLPGVATLFAPANNANTTTTPTFDWSDVVNTFGNTSVGAALYYDVYIDNAVVATLAYTPGVAPVSTWTPSSSLVGGAHTWKIRARNMLGSTDSEVRNFTVPTVPTPDVPSLDDPGSGPQSGDVVTVKPAVLNWDDSANATLYDIYFGVSGTPTASNLTSSTYTLPIGALDANYTWHVVAKNSAWSTVGPNWTFKLDTTPPSSTLPVTAPTTGAATFQFTVNYTDNLSGIDVSTLDSSDITVSGPNGYSANATFVSVNTPTDGTPRVATYSIPAPGGYWNDVDNGTYTVTQVGNQVSDVGGLFRAAGAVGTFNANVGFAWMSSGTLKVAMDGSALPVALSTNGGNVRASKNGIDADFAGVSAISVLGSSADDRVQINAPLAPSIAFDNTAGNDLVEIIGGSYTFAGDIATSSRNLGLHVAGGASALFNASQHLRSLSIDGAATLSAGGSKLLWVKDLQVTGQLNLTNNSFAWDYSSGTPIGAWVNGNAYDGIHGLISSGRATGSWTGLGLITNQANAMGTTPKTTLAVAESSTALGLDSGQTALFGTEVIDDSAVLVKYTFASDVDLSGSIDGDDFFAIDNNYNNPSPLYERGDFDLNGRMDADDYWLIDSNYVRQFT